VNDLPITADKAEALKKALENGEVSINTVRQCYGLSALKDDAADQRLKKVDQILGNRGR